MPAAGHTRFSDPLPIAYATMAVLAFGALLDSQRLMFAVSHVGTQTPLALPSPGLHVLVRLVTIALFAMWVDRIWANRTALGEKPGSSRIGAVMSFFVPPLCFFRPVQIVNEVWTSYGHRKDHWFSRLASAWWIALLIPPVIILTSIRGEPDRWKRVVAGETFNLIAALLAMLVLYLLSQRQREAAIRPRKLEHEACETEPRWVNAESPADTPVMIAPAVRPPLAPSRRAAQPVQRMIRGQHVQRRSLQQAIETISPRVWQIVVLAGAGIGVVALLGSGAVLIQSPRNLSVALIQLGFALIVAAAAFAVGRERPSSGEGRRWAMFAAAGALIAIIELFAVAEGLLR